MDKKSMIYWGMGILIFVGLIYLIIPSSGNGIREYDSFAQCLTDSGFIMYGTDWCPHCKAQKELFGASFDKIDYVNCDFNSEECAIAGVSGYPTWKFENGKFEGTQSLEVLALKSGCELAKDLE